MLLLPLAAACFEKEPSGHASKETSDVELVRIDFEQWQQQLKAYEASYVLVDFWAMWCAPCIEQFPKIVELHHEYKSKGVQFVSLSLDDPEDAPAIESAREFLRKNGAVFDNYLLDENPVQAFEKLELLGIPAIAIYGPNGQEVVRLTNDDPDDQFTRADIESALENLLGS